MFRSRALSEFPSAPLEISSEDSSNYYPGHSPFAHSQSAPPYWLVSSSDDSWFDQGGPRNSNSSSASFVSDSERYGSRSNEILCTHRSPSPSVAYKRAMSRRFALRFRRKNTGRPTHSTSMKEATAIYVTDAATDQMLKAPTTFDLNADSRVPGQDTLRFY